LPQCGHFTTGICTANASDYHNGGARINTRKRRKWLNVPVS
jgi:hypothetical protein